MNDGMWGIWVFAALGVFLWIDHQRCSRERLQAKVDLAEKLRAYVAMSDKQRAEYLEELSANIEEDEREERRMLDALRSEYRDKSGGVWRRLKRAAFFSGVGELRHGFVITRRWGDVELTRSHPLKKRISDMCDLSAEIRKFHSNERVREDFNKAG